MGPELSSFVDALLKAMVERPQGPMVTAVPSPVVIFENDRGQSWYVCGRARYVHEPRSRASSRRRAGRDRDDGPPDGDDARRRGGERPPDGDAHPPDASVTVPFMVFLPESA
jgi:hypothetical protein